MWLFRIVLNWLQKRLNPSGLGLQLKKRFHWRGQQLCKFIVTKKSFQIRRKFNFHGLVWNTNMAAVSLFWDTNMANVLKRSIERFRSRGQRLWKFIGSQIVFTWEKCSTAAGLAYDTNMASVLLFWDTNMADVTPCESSNIQTQILQTDLHAFP